MKFSEIVLRNSANFGDIFWVDYKWKEFAS